MPYKCLKDVGARQRCNRLNVILRNQNAEVNVENERDAVQPNINQNVRPLSPDVI
ncbi:hypothetical protein PV326_000494, partial [Microctonus aethiopoides]